MLYDMEAFYLAVIQRVASSDKVRVADWEWKSGPELLQDIEQINPGVSNFLKDFLDAHRAWRKVSENIEKAGSAGHLSPQENETLMLAIKKRDETREKLRRVI